MTKSLSKKELKTIERIASKSKLTQKDADELSEKIKKGAAKRFREKYKSNL